LGQGLLSLQLKFAQIAPYIVVLNMPDVPGELVKASRSLQVLHNRTQQTLIEDR
jgi:hypothetical protein